MLAKLFFIDEINHISVVFYIDKQMELTILTPTFNRRERLCKLYNSLQKQTCKEFEWLIVDDGSNDNTKELVNKWMKKKDVKVRYIYKENGGKHTALNLGIKIVESELIFIVDSDDWLSEDAVDIILRYHQRYSKTDNLCGYAFLRTFPDGKINGKEFVPNEMLASYIESRINSDDTMSDKAEVFYTKCLREFPFPEYDGEKFLGEDIVWIRMGQKYQMVHINHAIYVGNYLENGLTFNRRKHNIKSPVGCMNRAKEFMIPQVNLKYRIKATIQYLVYGMFSGITLINLLRNSPDKVLTLVFCMPGLVLYHKWKWDYK